jgi:prepilin-type N-terminal cleavage/methylation domain-containing protein
VPRITRRHGAARDERGVTLIETLIAMTIFATVVGLVMGVLVDALRGVQQVQARTDAIDQSRLALANIDRQVRSGDVLYNPAADPDTTAAAMSVPSSRTWQMRVFTQANGMQRCVQWQVIGGVLRTRSWTPTWRTDGLVSPWKVAARGVVNTPTQTPFALRGGGSTSAYQSRLLDVSLYVQTSSKGGAPVLVTSSLAGRNTIYGVDAGICTPVPAP